MGASKTPGTERQGAGETPSSSLEHKSAFSFDLPEALIARYPLKERTDSRLLYVPAKGGLQDLQFRDILRLLQAGDLLVLNDSKVIRARLYATKPSGGRVEILIERIVSSQRAWAQIKSNKKLHLGSKLIVAEDCCLQLVERTAELFCLELLGATQTFDQVLETYGLVPLPPYLKRPAEVQDLTRYQTVYAQHPGSVAAPTAGLHFDTPLLEQCRKQGVEVLGLTLHVGAGTFQPIRQDHLDQHQMHKEYFNIDPEVCDAVARCRSRGGRVVAVGSTVVRALETVAHQNHGELKACTGETNLFIRPGYTFQVVDCMLTNFHLPESSLFILVSAFAGYKRMQRAYRHAIDQAYRFFSYGDATWLERNKGNKDAL